MSDRKKDKGEMPTSRIHTHTLLTLHREGEARGEKLSRERGLARSCQSRPPTPANTRPYLLPAPETVAAKSRPIPTPAQFHTISFVDPRVFVLNIRALLQQWVLRTDLIPRLMSAVPLCSFIGNTQIICASTSNLIVTSNPSRSILTSYSSSSQLEIGTNC